MPGSPKRYKTDLPPACRFQRRIFESQTRDTEPQTSRLPVESSQSNPATRPCWDLPERAFGGPDSGARSRSGALIGEPGSTGRCTPGTGLRSSPGSRMTGSSIRLDGHANHRPAPGALDRPTLCIVLDGQFAPHASHAILSGIAPPFPVSGKARPPHGPQRTVRGLSIDAGAELGLRGCGHALSLTVRRMTTGCRRPEPGPTSALGRDRVGPRQRPGRGVGPASMTTPRGPRRYPPATVATDRHHLDRPPPSPGRRPRPSPRFRPDRLGQVGPGGHEGR